MDIQLQELIDKIKKDGIENAETEATRLREAAEAEAAAIVAEGKKQADALLAEAKAELERFRQAGETALIQAARNAMLTFKAEVDRLLAAITARETEKAFDDELLKAILPELLNNWKGGDLTRVLLSSESLKRLEKYLLNALSDELRSGLELTSGEAMGAGFKIVVEKGAVYYDFSAAAVAELLSAYVNPRLADLFKSAAGGL